MTHDEHEQILKEVLTNLGDQGKVTELLDNLRTDYTTTLANVDTLNNERTTITSELESIKKVNNKLFLKLGDTSEFSGGGQPPEKPKAPEEPQMKYEDLFDKVTGELI